MTGLIAAAAASRPECIRDATADCRFQGVSDSLAWEPYCGAEYPQDRTAGDPVICDRNAHGPDTQHRTSETGFAWW
jgi:hypothetical protein